ncbi:MAG: type IX secretion system outer membrane channel protein PorV [Bacteroidetes bacterium SB0662_bin_6]|nr:type IX secretion system outer membrane channel protein PorV [Bacteroidetes bacterium SB0668_bin_1]MYE03537.1 type IX secretion system outer membrane channel protein PorV [Bacteroidetes bacterium SB0662_bin_6]
MSRRFLAAAILTVFFATFASQAAHAQAGGAAVVFLQIEPDSRSAGMGNAGVAVANNAYAIFWNPAGLARQDGTEVSLTYSQWLPEFNADLSYSYLGGKHRVDRIGTFGAHLTYLFLGEHEGRDAQNNPTGTFKSYDLAAGASYGTNVLENLALGTGIRMIYSNLAPGQTVGAQETRAGVTIGFDIAGLYSVPRFQAGNTEVGVDLGFNLANMGPQIQYSDQGQADPIPQNLRFGYAVTFNFDEYNKLTLAQDFNKMLIRVNISEDDTPGSSTREADPFYKAIFSGWQPIDVRIGAANSEEDATYETLNAFNQMTIGTGFEYWYRDLFAIRAGYFYENPNFGNRKFLTFGSGVRWNIIGADFSYIYALEENHPLANTMRFSLLLNFLR